MASEQTEWTQPPASLAPSDLTASQGEEQAEWKPAHQPDTLPDMQGDTEGCRMMQSNPG